MAVGQIGVRQCSFNIRVEQSSNPETSADCPGNGVVAYDRTFTITWTVGADITISDAAAGTLVLAGQAPTAVVTTSATIEPAVGALTLAGEAPVVDASDNVTRLPAAGSLALAGQAPSVEEDHVVFPAVGGASLESTAPILATDFAEPIQEVAVTLSGQAPTLVIGTYIAPAIGELDISITDISGPGTAAQNSVAGHLGNSDAALGQGTNDFTVEFWARSSDASLGVIIGKRDASGLGWEILKNSTNLFFIVNDGVNIAAFESGAIPSDSTYRHYAWVVDRANDEMRIYIDGSLTAGSPYSIAAVTGSITATSDFRLFKAGHGDTQIWASGILDDVRIWSDVRTPQEISSNKDSALDGSEAGLMAYWKLDGTAGQDISSVTDDSPNSYTLTGGGSPLPQYHASTPLTSIGPADTAPLLLHEYFISPEDGSLTLAEYSPTLGRGGVSSPPGGTLTITSYSFTQRTKRTRIVGARTRFISLSVDRRLRHLYR
jgi:hypothetical protein